ncbi:MAG: ABC transporter permease, partial [Rikenellaceae bacterium]|nr:ABC transporter permease [Rikenellaceae bacterium]
HPISSLSNYPNSIKQLSGVKDIHRFAHKAGIVKNGEVMEGVLLKGYSDDFDWQFYEQILVRGRLPEVGSKTRNRDVLISERLAAQLSLDTASKVEMLFVQNPPRRDLYKVVGIYKSDFEEMDKILMLTDIRNIQRLNNWNNNQITGYEVNGYDLRDLDRLYDDVCTTMNADSTINESLYVSDLKQKNRIIFDWLATHDLNALVIIIVMLIVSVFNMAAALLIILLEKSKFIGILKTLGADNSLLKKVFIWRTIYIVTRGMLWGNIVGFALCALQRYTGAIKLDSAGYFLSQVPIAFNWWQLVFLNIGIFAVIIVCQVIPTHIISKISPEKSVRYE